MENNVTLSKALTKKGLVMGTLIALVMSTAFTLLNLEVSLIVFIRTRINAIIDDLYCMGWLKRFYHENYKESNHCRGHTTCFHFR